MVWRSLVIDRILTSRRLNSLLAVWSGERRRREMIDLFEIFVRLCLLCSPWAVFLLPPVKREAEIIRVDFHRKRRA